MRQRPAAQQLFADTPEGAADALLPLLAASRRASARSRAARPPRFAGTVLLLDGRSGSGKTALAAALTAALAAAQPSTHATPPTLVHLDDIYPGWGGLDAASRQITDEVLTAPAPRWRRHDWVLDRPAEWVDVDPSRPLIVEGVGALSRANAALATLTVWLELDEPTRRRRALARDGAAYEPHWNEWAAHEAAFIAREHPQAQADVVIDVTPR